MIFSEAKEILVNTKLNSSLRDIEEGTNQLFSSDDITRAINIGLAKIIDYKLWPFTEGSFTLTGLGPYAYEAGFEWESAFLAIVDGVPWMGRGAGKRNFADYMKWFSDYPNDTSKIWAEYGGELFFNPNALSANPSIVLYGKFVETVEFITPDNDGQVLPIDFENGSDMTSANEALIDFAYAYLLASEKKKNPQQAAIEEKKGYAILDTLWGKISERKAQHAPQNRPFFNTQDNYRTGGRSTGPIGNFDL